MTAQDDDRRFTLRETMDYNPQYCPVCGLQTLNWRFVQAAGPDESEELWTRSSVRCSNRRCALNGGPDGDIAKAPEQP